MEEFVIDKVIREQFDYFKQFCEFMAPEDYESSFEPAATIEQVEEWEKENDTQLPHQYKSWLLLSSESYILSGYLELFWPTIGTLEESNDIVIIGTVVGDGEEVGIRRNDGTVYSIFDGEVREYKDFDDFLTHTLYFMQEMAAEDIGDDWEEQFNEMFGNI